MKKFFVAMSILLMITPMCVMPMKKQTTSIDKENIPLLLNAMPKIENFTYNNFEINVKSKDNIEEHKVNVEENCSILKPDGDNNRSELVIKIDNLGEEQEIVVKRYKNDLNWNDLGEICKPIVGFGILSVGSAIIFVGVFGGLFGGLYLLTKLKIK